jgi:hypothetical protein
MDLVVSGAQFALDALAEDVLAHARQPARLIAKGVRWTTKVALFPARFLYTADTGEEGTNHAAAEHYRAQEAPGAALVEAALDWRMKPPTPDHAIAVVGPNLVPLYEHYLADHIERLESSDELELAEAFHDWRSRLVSA